MKLYVDIQLLDKIGFKMDQLVQFIGEVFYEKQKSFLRARIYRVMEGFDLNLYEKTINIKREWESENFNN